MKRFVLVVLDGFGIGAMNDVPVLRPQDQGANTAIHIFEALPKLKLPTLASLGLGNAILTAGHPAALPETLPAAESCCYGVHNLAHFGADTFWGHQELMGTKPLKGESAPIKNSLPAIRDALEAAGHQTRFYRKNDTTAGILIVDEAVTIGDNLETDLGDNYNVTAALDFVAFEEVKKIGTLVRSMVRTSRVIIFGGKEVSLKNLLDAYESRQGYAGVNAPRSGVYRHGYQVLHLGFGVNAKLQVSAILAKAGIPTVLIGKAADIVENPNGKNLPGVDTEDVLAEALAAIDSLAQGFICVNVQETDLAGHREDPALYGECLSLSDQGIKRIMDKLGNDDLMVVTADHGNDPAIGHPQHTREKTPILAWSPRIADSFSGREKKFLGERSSLADTGATVCDFFGVRPPESGSSYMEILKKYSTKTE